MKNFQILTTPFESDVGTIPYSEYPRPNMKRNSYLTLNGAWTLEVFKQEEKTSYWRGNILVPFPPQSKMSGVCKDFEYTDTLVYKRSFILPEDFVRERVILHFGAVDRLAIVTVNDTIVGSHDGGYLPFSFDITEALISGENTIVVSVFDDLNTDYPYGKQSKRRGGMWYTPISGIWQSVWLESVCDAYVKSLKISTDTDKVKISTVGGVRDKKLIIYAEDGEGEYLYSGNSIEIIMEEPHLWTPDDPYLYRFTLICGDDTIDSYFALRRIDIEKREEKAYITLNGKPVFLHGLLDQGYYSDGIYLPATPEGYRNDIITMKKLGFNTLRKHIKIEPQLFYYYCDLYGMIVCQDMVNCGKYNFLIDTALPTVAFKRGITHKASKKRREIFERECRQTVELLHNHPSVCYYTIFNEGWGQYDADRIYSEMKSLDPSRLWDTTSGWFKETLSDVESEHIYFKPIEIKSDGTRPVILSEFGGYSYKIEGHSFNPYKTYGYGKFKDKESYEGAMTELYLGQVLFAISKGLCGAILTQVSDVEDETNGLFTYDRQVLKVDVDNFLKISNELKKVFDLQFEN